MTAGGLDTGFGPGTKAPLQLGCRVSAKVGWGPFTIHILHLLKDDDLTKHCHFGGEQVVRHPSQYVGHVTDQSQEPVSQGGVEVGASPWHRRLNPSTSCEICRDLTWFRLSRIVPSALRLLADGLFRSAVR